MFDTTAMTKATYYMFCALTLLYLFYLLILFAKFIELILYKALVKFSLSLNDKNYH